MDGRMDGAKDGRADGMANERMVLLDNRRTRVMGLGWTY